MFCGFGVALETEVLIETKAMGFFYSHGFFV